MHTTSFLFKYNLLKGDCGRPGLGWRKLRFGRRQRRFGTSWFVESRRRWRLAGHGRQSAGHLLAGQRLRPRWSEVGESTVHRAVLAEQVVEHVKVLHPSRVGGAVADAIQRQAVVKLLAHGHDGRAVKRQRGDAARVCLVVAGSLRGSQPALRRPLQVGRGKIGKSGGQVGKRDRGRRSFGEVFG